MANFFDQFDSAAPSPAPPAGNFFDQFDAAPSGKPERYQTWPERLVRGIGSAIAGLPSLPERALKSAGDLQRTGTEYDPAPIVDAATLVSPVSPGYRLGSRFGAPPVEGLGPTPGTAAAVTATELGAPLPRGLASDSRAVQGLTQASRQLPFVGAAIDKGAAETVGRAGEAVTDLATTLGSKPRAEVGADLRTALTDVVEANKGQIDQAYGSVRSLIDSKAVAVPQNTKTAFESILARRTEAGQPNPAAGLEQIQNIVTKGVNFDGLIRAKSDLAQSVDFLTAHAGFSTADKKMLGAAMSKDLGDIAAKATVPGVAPQSAVTALRQAEAEASKLITRNQTISKLTANQRDEGLAGSLLNAAGEKNGNLKLVAELKGQLPKGDFDKISGTLLAELGHNPATGEFSLAKFATNWEKQLSPGAKGIMFPGQHGKFLTDIAELGKFLKGGEQYRNTSNTGRAVALGTILTTGGSAVTAAVMGAFAPLLGFGASLAGGYLIAKSLAKPAAAASLAAVARNARSYQKAPSAAKKATLLLAGRNATNTIAAVNDVSPAEFLRLLNGPVKGTSEPSQ